MTKAWADATKTKIACTLNLFLRDAAGTTITNARVTGGWVLTTAANGAANTATPWTAYSTAPGAYIFRSGSLPNLAGTSCRFTVQQVQAAGYQFDAASSVMTRTLSW
jgi:hypothetical protein